MERILHTLCLAHKNIFLIGLLALLSVPWSCTSDKKVDTQAVREEIKSREIKRATDAEIVSKIHEIGNSVAMTTKKTLGKNLKQALENGGVENAVSFCKLNAMVLIDSLEKSFGVEIKRATLKARNPHDLPNTLEKELLEAYAYQWKDSLPLQTNVQALDENRYLYTKPILIDNELCLKCHGTTENGLSKGAAEFIKSRYPNDKATGYQVGDLRGIWSIVIPKKVAVQAL